MSTAVRAMMAFISASFALSLVALIGSPDGPHGSLPVAMTWMAVTGAVSGGLLWACQWPTWLQSAMFGLVCNTSIALACLAHPDPLASLIGCIAFATSGAHIAFLHGTRFVLYNFAVAAGVAMFEAIRLASSGHVTLAAVALFLVLHASIASPFAIRGLVRALGVDLLRADRDPLTGLFNRRAFHQKALGLVAARRPGDAYLIVALVDLDNFKAINDNYGHAAGDRALVQVVQAIRANTRDTAVIARSGGEEFLIADTSSAENPRRPAQRICAAVAALPVTVTASIGTASAPLDAMHQPDLDHLIAVADAAMYHAKRSGGNNVHHHEPAPPTRHGIA
ncbi:GGDEF domain-containing protein [Mycobacterium sp. BMJ-28]